MKRLSDDAILLLFGWFSFGAKATVTSNPPHANMSAQQSALDELLEAGLITHEHEENKRYRIDRHIFRGTPAIGDALKADHAQKVLKKALGLRAAHKHSEAP